MSSYNVNAKGEVVSRGTKAQYEEAGEGSRFTRVRNAAMLVPMASMVSKRVPEGLGSALPLYATANPAAARSERRQDANFIRSGRVSDQAAGTPMSFNAEQNRNYNKQMKTAGAPISDLLAAEYALSVIEVERRQPKHSFIEKVSQPYARVVVDTPMVDTMYSAIVGQLAETAIDLSCEPGLRKTSGIWDTFKNLGSSVKGVLTDPTPKGGRNVAQKMIYGAAALPLLAVTLKGVDAGFQGASRQYNRALEGRRFEGAFEQLLLNPDAQADILDHSTGQLDRDRVAKLRSDFSVLNKYAPTVAKDPNLAGAYLETMVYRNAAHGSAAEYMRNVKEFAGLEKSLRDNSPGLNTPLLGSV